MKATRTEILPFVSLTCVQTDKFKTNCISINLLTQLSRETASRNALIPRVLRRGTKSYPDMEALSAALDNLYGAHIEPVVYKKGEIQTLGFYADFIDDRFVPENQSLLPQISGLLSELLLFPATRGGFLVPEYVESEREKLLEQLRARINEKRGYSILRMIELMCYSEDYAIDGQGTEEEAAHITHAQLTTRYQELLHTAPIEIFYCGSAEPATVAATLKEALKTLPRGEIAGDIGTDIRLNAMEETPRYFEDSMDVSQGKLAIGFRLGPCMEDPDIPAIRVMNAIFGGSVTSKLFMNVREKLSLAYFASSFVDVHKGILGISSGIEFEKYEDALSEIFTQLDAVQKGDIAPDELEAAARYVAASYRTVVDSTASLFDYYLSQSILGLDDTPEAFADLCEAVTKEQVVSIAKGIECDAIYFLKGPNAPEGGQA